ncbi:OmpA family protein [Hymenobacter sp. BRD67]|uniref:OmpA family protein n=1 Tax=Hymenobacter sp. BRD67 TaxID=2675877 RepID=UPI001564CF59|nr:OmpA family protein [Hymenobacter sp. BRD67]QKG52393.1 OmpA family protein [Hymenobacter sp. BRD67]
MKHLLFKTAMLSAAGLLAAAPRSQAQSADRKWGVSGYVSALQYHGDLGENYWDTRSLTYGGGLTLSHYLSKGIDINLSGNQATLRYPADPSGGGTFTTPYNGPANAHRFYANVTSLGLGFKFKLNNGWALKEDAFIQPYILLQPGLSIIYTDRYAAYSTVASHLSYGSFDAQAAVGLTFRLTPGVSLFAQAGQHMLFSGGDDADARLDGVSSNSVTWLNKYDRYMQFSAGLTANFGKAKDMDGDGVPDRKDKCPDTPAGVKVDVNGCPVDTDGDGVADYQDKCPTVKGLVALQGCPDADGDGVADADDKCPNTPAGVRVDASGCPLDADGDGVPDYLDKCPGTPSGVKVDASGCPLDRDGDGVPDYQDRCPDRAGPASNKGCPEIKAEAKKILNEATKYINFDFDKATLKPSSYPKLEQMVQIMNDYPDYSLSIAGHTDSKGDDAYNLRLSYERAASARAYMLSKGIPADRIESRGYGETKPIADNKTAAGQALNRRVDFDPFLTGEPNAAEVKYGPAPAEPSEAEVKKAVTKKAPARKAPAHKAPVKRKK